MNGKDVLVMADLVAREKGLAVEKVLQSLEIGIATDLKKNFPLGVEISVSIDPKNNSIEAWRLFYIVDKIDDFETQITLKSAKEEKTDRDLIEDGIFYQKIDLNLSRKQFNITRQVALQKLKTEIKENILENLADKKEGLLTGIVKTIKKDMITLEYANMDILLPKNECFMKDRFKLGERVFFVLDKTTRSATNTLLFASRNNEKFLIEVLKKEVPLIEDGKILIEKISKINGYGFKLALFSANPKIDTIKEVVGFRGATAKKIKSYFSGENIDFVLYDGEITQFLINCLQPLSPLKISMDEDLKTAEIVVSDDDFDYSQRPRYQKHITNLTGWQIIFYKEQEWNFKNNQKSLSLLKFFEKALDIDEELAQSLIDLQFEKLEEIAFTPIAEFLTTGELDEETANEIKSRAKEALNNDIFVNFEKFMEVGFSVEQILKLNENKIITTQDLADLDTFELEEILPDTSNDFRQKAIMSFR